MPELKDELDKLYYVFDQLDLLNSMKDSGLNDFHKRTLFRFYFVSLDNFLKLIGWIKNETRRRGKLSIAQTRELEQQIKTLRSSYDANYDLVRDKLTAHQQEVNLVDTITWWNEIDCITIGVFHDDLTAIRSTLIHAYPNLAVSVDPFVVDFSDQNLHLRADTVQFNATRLSMAIPNAVSLLPGPGAQQKASMVTAAMRFLKSNFYLTLKGENYRTPEQKLLFEMAWFLVIIDLTSILDCLFDDSKEPSLNTLWNADGTAGHVKLTEFVRDAKLESAMREVRNKIAAHIDSQSPLAASLGFFEKIDLAQVHSYTCKVVDIFLDACRADIRTKMFVADGLEIENAFAVTGTAAKPFNS